MDLTADAAANRRKGLSRVAIVDRMVEGRADVKDQETILPLHHLRVMCLGQQRDLLADVRASCIWRACVDYLTLTPPLGEAATLPSDFRYKQMKEAIVALHDAPTPTAHIRFYAICSTWLDTRDKREATARRARPRQ